MRIRVLWFICPNYSIKASSIHQSFPEFFDKQLLEHINNELNKTFSSESVWTRDSISSWLDEAKSETWSMVDLVQEMETRSVNDVVSNSLSLNLDAKTSEGTTTDTTMLSINDHQMNWNEDHKIL